MNFLGTDCLQFILNVSENVFIQLKYRILMYMSFGMAIITLIAEFFYLHLRHFDVNILIRDSFVILIIFSVIPTTKTIRILINEYKLNYVLGASFWIDLLSSKSSHVSYAKEFIAHLPFSNV